MSATTRYVNPAVFDPDPPVTLTPEQQRYYEASQWRLMWWRFKRHKLAVVSGVFLLILYFSLLIMPFLAPYELHERHSKFVHAPPQMIHLWHDGEFVGPHVKAYKSELDLVYLKRNYVTDENRIHKIAFFCDSYEYSFYGLFKTTKHLACPADNGTMFLLGTDRMGRDVLSRIMYGARISLTVGLIGVSVAFLLGIILGGLSGYYGGWVDNVIQRIIEVINSFPVIPLWMALSAAMPVNWDPLLVYFGITIILGLIDWTGLARAVRSKLLSLREEDYAMAAKLAGAGPGRIIGRHLLPGFTSHLIASATLAIPGMILGETALSFLGLGVRAPMTSWGVLLNDAQNVQAVALYPWLMLPVVPVILVVLAFNFLGDGLRDAADPYH